ncbi:hypothetical protein ASPZODRAFT_139605 [Penicilliopsis zonata CBS 506.65]|uniref:Uncharacterized protein n=1 Tax=Penicilliopsis zonata CBS 506.65 TaxID=1073090 RepID=A0A1L9ST58_9EURO|nr:hypothetical protein ASPZODRAFT_139605 [Penicilliopsis zonata CBS 506.65]OJJ50294.1 hypothetical protein ASPZODRAFT_139605 [Penicilliopsis zonata CBS 506.65]
MRPAVRVGLALLLVTAFFLFLRALPATAHPPPPPEARHPSPRPHLSYWPFGDANAVAPAAPSEDQVHYVGDEIDLSEQNKPDEVDSLLRDQQQDGPYATVPISTPNDRTIVVGKFKNQNTDWVTSELNEWRSVVYTLDDKTAPLHTPSSKGLESLAYLQYIIDHYHNLPQTMIFLQSDRNGQPQVWRVGQKGYYSTSSSSSRLYKRDLDNVHNIKNLQLDYVQKVGYANLRCTLTPGCPAEIQPFRNPPDPGKDTENAYAAAWEQLFNNTDVPSLVAVPCCSQFAVSRAQVLRRPYSDYERFYNWLLETPLPDATSTRILEYSWHIIFGQDPVHCPELRHCYRNVYGRGY